MNTPANIVKPWYREPWPWILMAGPAVVIVAGIFTAGLAIHSADGLVDDDYYKQGLAVSQRVERDQKAVELGLVAEFMLSAEAREVRLFLTAKGETALPEKLELRLTHPTQAGQDQKVTLTRDAQGFYSGKLVSVPQGRWYVALEDAAHVWRLTGEWNTLQQQTLRLTAATKVSSNQHGG